MIKTKRKSRKTKVCDVILSVFAAITLVNYGMYFVHQLFFPESTTAFLISLFVIAITLLPILFRKRLKLILKKAFPVMKSVWGAGLAFYVISFAVVCSVIFIGASGEVPGDEVEENTVFIIYGAKVRGEAENAYPGNALKLRLDKALSVMEDVPGSVCIVCGGKGENENAAEGDVMKKYLVSRGMEEERIYVDAESKNTLENIKYSMQIIEDENLDKRAVACVSTGFHIPRIRYLCKREGLSVSYCYYAASPNSVSLYTSLVREYMSWWKLLLTGHL